MSRQRAVDALVVPPKHFCYCTFTIVRQQHTTKKMVSTQNMLTLWQPMSSVHLHSFMIKIILYSPRDVLLFSFPPHKRMNTAYFFYILTKFFECDHVCF